MSQRLFFCALLAVTVGLLTLGARADYTKDRALSALFYCKASYCDAKAIENWSCESCSQQPSFQLKRVVTNVLRGTQAFTGTNNNSIIVAFRGSSNIPNWINNLEFVHSLYSAANCKRCGVHKGFLQSYDSLKDQLWEDIQALVRAHPSFPILVTGHSLGGAMATLAAADLATRSYSLGKAPHIELYTYGSPRVGNRAFADWFARLFCSGGHESYRVTHKSDLVPHVGPLFLGYVHVSKELWYNNNSDITYRSCNDSDGINCALSVDEDSQCSNSLWFPTSIADHLLYLGVCTSCSCNTLASKMIDRNGGFVLSERIKLLIAADKEYQRNRELEKYWGL